jgi:hypothetical protein
MIGPELAGIASEPATVSWDARDVMLSAARFQVHREDGRVACDRGLLTFFAA